MAKILLVSSSGGHYSELMQINRNNKENEYVIVTETKNKEKLKDQNKDINYFLKYGTRSSKVKYANVLMSNIKEAFKIIKKEKPDVIISTGAHSCVPFFYIGKLFGCKTIYIESYAKVMSPSLTYKLIKNKADKVIVQHEEMLDVYKEAKYLRGGIY